MTNKTVGRKDFELAREELLEHISQVLNSEFDDIAGFKAGDIVDIDIEENKATGVVGIRMDNDFGVVGGENAILFAEALELAARIANDFKYLGMVVSDER